MTPDLEPALHPDLFGQLAATDPYQKRSRRLFERGQVIAVSGNQADLRLGLDARNNPLDLKEVPIVSGYLPRVGDWVAVQYEAGQSGAPWVIGPSMAEDASSDPAGIGVFPVLAEEPTGPQKSTIYFDEARGLWRGWDGSDWVDVTAKLHNSLPDLQGGAAGAYYHLLQADYAALTDGTAQLTALHTGGAPEFAGLKLSGLAAGSVVYVGAGGALSAGGSLLWNGASNLLAVVGKAAVGLSSTSYRLHLQDQQTNGIGSPNLMIDNISNASGAQITFRAVKPTVSELPANLRLAAYINARPGSSQNDSGVITIGTPNSNYTDYDPILTLKGKDAGTVTWGQLSGHLSIPATRCLYLDGGGNSYLTETAADVIAVITGGSERLRVDSTGQVGLGVTAPKARLHASGSTIVGAANAAAADGDLGSSQVNVWLDETNHRLYFKCKYSGGAVKSGYVALT